MVSEEFSTPKVKAGGKFFEFSFRETHKKLYIRPESIEGVSEAREGGDGSMLHLTSGQDLLVEQEVVQIVATLTLRSKKTPDGEPPADEPFDNDPTAVKLEGGIEG